MDAPDKLKLEATVPARVSARMLPLIVVGAMLAGAQLSGQRDVIFPEGAALAFGIAVLRNPEWSASRWRIVALPTACAVIGHLLTRLPTPTWTAEICGVTLALVLLAALRSRVAPALSAAVLPVVFDVRSWLYPTAVLATCVVIVLVVTWSTPEGGGAPSVVTVAAWRWDVIVGGWLMIGAWIVIAGPVLSLPTATLAPPLFVSAFEWSAKDTRLRDPARRRWTLLVCAALAGSIFHGLTATDWIAGLCALATTIMVMRALATPHAPALAISIVPLIAGPAQPWCFTTAIAIGAGALYLSAACVARARNRLRSRTARA